MKKSILLFTFAVSLAACTSKNNPLVEQQLLKMLEGKDLFRLEAVLAEKRAEISKVTALYLDAHLQNAFNQTEKSLQTVNRLLNSYGKELNDTLLLNVLLVKYDNLHKQTRYGEAVETLENAMSKYSYVLDSVGISNLQETYNSIAPFKELLPLKVHVAADVSIPIFRNRFNHVIMKVKNEEQSEDFIFDTGAMQSVVSESCARRMGIRVFESSVNVGNSIGSKVQSKVGVADSLRIGDMLLENVTFLVLPDEMLSFPQANYFIHGVIGFPVMYQMKEVVICKDERIIVAANPKKRNLHNLFFDGFSPFVRFNADGVPVLFKMDTGASTTEFSERYFNSNKDKILEEASLKTVKRGGAGGINEYGVYELANVQLQIGGRELTVPNIHALTDNLSFLENCDGNLGQDVLTYFNRLVLNFESMYLTFED